MADLVFDDVLIAERTIPEYVKRGSYRYERSGDLNFGDTLRVAFQVKRSGQSTWNTFDTLTYSPTYDVPVGRTLDLIAEFAIYERDE